MSTFLKWPFRWSRKEVSKNVRGECSRPAGQSGADADPGPGGRVGETGSSRQMVPDVEGHFEAHVMYFGQVMAGGVMEEVWDEDEGDYVTDEEWDDE